jgi:hypothetical protein
MRKNDFFFAFLPFWNVWHPKTASNYSKNLHVFSMDLDVYAPGSPYLQKKKSSKTHTSGHFWVARICLTICYIQNYIHVYIYSIVVPPNPNHPICDFSCLLSHTHALARIYIYNIYIYIYIYIHTHIHLVRCSSLLHVPWGTTCRYSIPATTVTVTAAIVTAIATIVTLLA